jgi:hypothetical protein
MLYVTTGTERRERKASIHWELQVWYLRIQPHGACAILKHLKSTGTGRGEESVNPLEPPSLCTADPTSWCFDGIHTKKHQLSLNSLPTLKQPWMDSSIQSCFIFGLYMPSWRTVATTCFQSDTLFLASRPRGCIKMG